MSWDLYVQDWGDVKSLTDIPEGYEPKPIGTRSEIISQIKKIEPLVDFKDQSIGRLENDQFSIEFNLGHEEIVSSFAMHVRGNELALPCIGQILSKLNLKAADGSSADFFDVENSKQAMRKWIDFRNEILKE
jgi:hypothetical protein